MSPPPLSPLTDFGLRDSDADRYYACLFLPEAVRDDIMALYAFNADIAMVRERVREALPGEMRLAWWRETLTGQGRGADNHPLAMALLAALKRHDLPVQPLIDLIDARAHDLYDDLFATTHDLIGYCGETSSALMRLAGLMLCRSGTEGADAFGHGGVAYALAGLMRAFPYQLRQGRLMWPQDLLERHGLTHDVVLAGTLSPELLAAWGDMLALAKSHEMQALAALGEVKAEARLALLPLMLVEGDLKRLAARTNPYDMVPPPPAWRRIWSLWRGSKRL